MPQFLDYNRDFLNLHHTLTCGQAFRWKLNDDGWWTAPVKSKVIRIKEADSGFLWETLPGEPDIELFHSYFRLDTDVPSIYEHLARSDKHVAELIRCFRGLRLLRQDPEETLITYLCSPVNFISRISQSIERISARYGKIITHIGEQSYYSFPKTCTLAEADPDELCKIGRIGWRGRDIVTAAKQIFERTPDWLDSLRSASYDDAKSELLRLRGIGPKIADCICLFALDKDEAVPIDTHIRQAIEELYMPELSGKSLTPALYKKIAKVFNDKFNKYAGWAQEYLYYEDLLYGRTAKPRSV